MYVQKLKNNSTSLNYLNTKTVIYLKLRNNLAHHFNHHCGRSVNRNNEDDLSVFDQQFRAGKSGLKLFVKQDQTEICT